MDEAYEETEVLLQELERQIAEEYRQAAREVEKKCNEYLENFKKEDEEKKKKLEDGKISQKKYYYWRYTQIVINKRWEGLKKNLTDDLKNANEIAASIINRQLPKAYAINHNYGTYEVEKGSFLNTSYTLYSQETVERLLRSKPNLLPKAKVDVPKDKKWNRQKLQSAIVQGVLQGKSINDISKKLQHVTDMNQNVAVRNARTMMTSAQNGGRIDAYKRAEKMGIKTTKVWLATPDSRVRDSHARLDGEERENEEEFSNGCKYPGDPNGDPAEVWNCRCTLIAQVKSTPRIDVSERKLGGLERDYVNGENMTYQDWKDLHSEDESIRQEARKKWKESEIGKQRRKRN